jgi:hypothetical protein
MKSIALVAAILGTAISLAVGVVVANQFGSPYQYIIGLLSELVVVIFSIGSLGYESIEKIINSIKTLSGSLTESALLAKANDMVERAGDPAFRSRYSEIKQALIGISNGHYSIPDLAGVYADDVETINSMRSGDVLKSMCPVGGVVRQAEHQFLNRSFGASMQAHYSAVSRGAVVQRIYIFESRNVIEKSKICRSHLNEACSKGIAVRIIILDEKPFEFAGHMPHDFVIFSERKVSVGRVGSNSRVDGADVHFDEISIRDYLATYQRLMDQSDEVGEYVDGSGAAKSAL